MPFDDSSRAFESQPLICVGTPFHKILKKHYRWPVAPCIPSSSLPASSPHRWYCYRCPTSYAPCISLTQMTSEHRLPTQGTTVMLLHQCVSCGLAQTRFATSPYYCPLLLRQRHCRMLYPRVQCRLHPLNCHCILLLKKMEGHTLNVFLHARETSIIPNTYGEF